MSESTAPLSTAVPLTDIQAGIFDPTALAVETHLFLAIASGVSGREFLRAIISKVSTEAGVAAGDAALAQVRVNLGITCPGLLALGVDPATVASFPQEFQQGMAARASILGDNGASAPGSWEPTFKPGSDGNPSFHLWLMVQAPDAPTCDAEVATLTALAASFDVAMVGSEEGAQLGSELAPAKEHFGFNDNLSQPGVEGVGQPVYPGQGTLRPDGTWAPIPLGCFLLGHQNGFGETPAHPSDQALRQNSSFMVLRKLSQDVAAFRASVKETAQLLAMDEEQCAAKFVGRWRSGAPLELTPDHDDPSILADPETANAFAYRAPTCPHDPTPDIDGVRVPRLAHIRRVNPRDSLNPTSVVDPTNHRIIRRSAPYGPFLPESAAADDGQPRGLLFRAFNASILDQFEMIQSEWVNNANEANGLSTDRDPLVGSVEPMGPPERQLSMSFTIPRADGSCPTRYGLPQFVTVKGGAYFFVPSLSALAHLATDPPPPPAAGPGLPPGTFVDVYRSIVVAPGNPAEAVLREQIGLVLGYQSQLVTLGNELRADDSTKIFPTPIGVLLSTFADIKEVFTTDDVFSVGGYGARLTDITGPFILGMDAGPQYERESAIMKFVAPPSDFPALQQWIDQYAATVVKAAAKVPGSTFDLVPTVANRVPLGFVDHYFGVPGPNDETFMTWLRAIGIYVFEWWSTLFPEIKVFTTSISPTFETYLDGVIASRSAAIAGGESVPDDVLTRLLGLPGVDSPNHPLSLDRFGIRRNLAGFALGSSVALATAIVSAAQYLLDPQNSAALATSSAAAKAGDDDLVRQCMLEATRLGPPSPPSVFRTALADYTLAAGTPRQRLIPRGSIVVLNPAIAMTDPEVFDDPMTFRPGRPAENYMMFGEGMHTCFGTAIATMIITSVGKALFSLEGLHAVSTMANGVSFPASGYPASYLLSTSTSTS